MSTEKLWSYFTGLTLLVVFLFGLVILRENTPDWKGKAVIKGAPELPKDPIAAGKKVFTDRGCGGCHTIAGVSTGTVGPELTKIGTKLEKDYLIKWIDDPPKVKPGTQMPKLGLTPDELEAVASYLVTLK